MASNYSERLQRGSAVLAHFGGDWSRMLANAEYRDGSYHVRLPEPASAHNNNNTPPAAGHNGAEALPARRAAAA